MRLFFTFSFLFIISFLSAQTADGEIVIDSTKAELKIIEISEISNETERLNERFSELNSVLKKDKRIVSIDSVLAEVDENIQTHLEYLSSDSVLNTYRRTESEIRKWKVLKERVYAYKETVNERSDELNKISTELYEYLEIWGITKEESITRELNEEIIASIESVMSSIESMIQMDVSRSDSVFLLQKKITGIVILIDDVILQLNQREKELRKGYFIIDSPPIWQAKDSTASRSYVITQFKRGLKDDKDILEIYVFDNIPTLVFQILYFLLLLGGMMILRRKLLGKFIDLSNEIGRRFVAVLNNPVSVITVIGVLTSLYFYQNRPLILGEFALYVLMIPTIYLLPKLVKGRIRPLIIVAFITLHIYLFQNYATQEAFVFRLALYVNLILLLIILLRIAFASTFKRFKKTKWGRIARAFVFFYILLSLIGIVANTIGSVNLSKAISDGLLISISLAFVVLLFIRILINVSLMILKTRVETSIETISALVEMINVRVRPLLQLLGFVIWLGYTLMGFNVLTKFINKISQIFTLRWEMGSVSISIGGILSFLMILIVTFSLTRIISNVLNDEWVIKTLPKGTSSGTSMVMRIVIVCVGIYLAFTSAGLDLTELSFILGALGVGIGFGLQSVVLNFIAGLILAFERPIIVGDVIMADMEMGVVSEIGVRASKLKLYDGSEVILPNGDLISKKVTNYTLSDYKRRSKVIVKTSVNSDPNEVIEILTSIAVQQENTLDDPAPKTYFNGYGDSSLDFSLLFWTHFDNKFSTNSAIALEIHNQLKEKGIHLPIPMIIIDKSKEEKTDEA